MVSRDLEDRKKILESFSPQSKRTAARRGFNNDYRRAIYEKIESSKGISIDLLSSQLGYSESIIKYHLNYLEKHNIITKDPNLGKYYKS